MRIVCLLIGYCCGCVLIADLVARARTGKPAREFGTKNPGTVNVTEQLGAVAGGITLFGDCMKVVIAYVLCRFFVAPDLGQLCALWAGLGATLGHDFPFWTRFHGGIGVATTCATIILFSPTWGWLALVTGFIVAAVSQQLSVAAITLTVVFVPIAGMLNGWEAALLALAFVVLMISKNTHEIYGVYKGTQPKTDVIGNLRKLFRRS